MADKFEKELEKEFERADARARAERIRMARRALTPFELEVDAALEAQIEKCFIAYSAALPRTRRRRRRPQPDKHGNAVLDDNISVSTA